MNISRKTGRHSYLRTLLPLGCVAFAVGVLCCPISAAPQKAAGVPAKASAKQDGKPAAKAAPQDAMPGGFTPTTINALATKSLEKMVDYTNKDFKLKYPANWKVRNDTKPPQVLEIELEDGMVGTDMVVDTLGTAISLEEYAKAIVEGIKELPSKPKILSMQMIDVHGTPARRYVYTNAIMVDETHSVPLRQTMIVCIKGKKGFTLTSQTLEKFYSAFEKVFNTIAQSFTPSTIIL